MTLRDAVIMAIEAIERGSATAPVLECLKAALAEHDARPLPATEPSWRE